MQRTTTHTRINRVSALAAAFLLVLALAVPVCGPRRKQTANYDRHYGPRLPGPRSRGDKVDVESIARGYQDPQFRGSQA